MLTRPRAAPCAPTTPASRRRRTARLSLAPGARGVALRADPGRAVTEIELEPADGGTRRTVAPDDAARLRGLRPLRPAPGAARRAAQLDEALDGLAPGRLERALEPCAGGAGARTRHDVPLPDAAAGRCCAPSSEWTPGTPRRPVALEEVRLPEPALPGAARAALVARVGEERRARRPRGARRARGGQELPGPGALRSGDASGAPDAVVVPAVGTTRCAAVLEACAARGRGRGARSAAARAWWAAWSRCAAASRAWSRSTCARIDRARWTWTAASLPATLRGRACSARGGGAAGRAGADPRPLPAVVRVLHRRRLGGHPLRRAGLDRLRPHRRAGGGPSRCIDARPASWRPRRARPPPPGPLRELVVGSEGALGVITEATLRVRPAPEARRYEGWSFRTFDEGVEAFRALEQAGAAPDVARLSDEEETRLSMALAARGAAPSGSARPTCAPRGHEGGCIAIVGLRGRAATTWLARRRARRRAAAGRRGRLRSAQRPGRGLAARPLPRPLPARRAAGPRRDGRDARDGDHLERAARRLYAAVGEALRERARRARHAAARAVPRVAPVPVGRLALLHLPRPPGATAPSSSSGAPPRRPHGRDRGRRRHDHPPPRRRARPRARGWRPRWGSSGVELLRAAKERLDPAGIMNPGKLLPG